MTVKSRNANVCPAGPPFVYILTVLTVFKHRLLVDSIKQLLWTAAYLTDIKLNSN